MVEQGEPGQCELLSGFFSYFLQAVIAVLALATLLYKRKIEKPQRDFVTWGFDVTKQLVGSVLVHMWNIGLARKWIVVVQGECTQKKSTISHEPPLRLFFFWQLS